MYYQPNNIGFGMSLFDDIARRAQRLGWQSGERILEFEFSNHLNVLEIRLRILPGNEVLRRAIYEFAQSRPAVFRPHPRLIAHTPIFRRTIVSTNELEGADLESLRGRIERSWEDFLHEDLPRISEALGGFEIPAPVRASTPPAA